MVAIKAADAVRFTANPDPARPVVLIYGPDSGLVRERAAAIIRKSVDSMDDPFSLVRMDGDALSGEPGRLVEEANTIPMFGGRRAVWVRSGARNIAPAVEMLLKATAPDCRVVIEAGELRRNAPLRTLCERAANAAAIPCYEDNAQAIARLIDDEMREADLTIAGDAKAVLVPLLGGDRSASRNEIRKLALYARGKGRVELDDVMAVVTDASSLALDAVIDAAFAGRTADLDAQYAKATTAGTSPGTIMFSVLRQVAALHKARLTVEAGMSTSQVVESFIPPLHFSRKALVEAALRNWTAARLERAMTQLADAAFDVRRQAGLADTLAHRALLSLAVNARRRE